MKLLLSCVLTILTSSLLAHPEVAKTELKPSRPINCEQPTSRSVNRTKALATIDTGEYVEVLLKTQFFKCKNKVFKAKELGSLFNYWTTNGLGNYGLKNLENELIYENYEYAIIKVKIDKEEIETSRKFKFKVSRSPFVKYVWKVKVTKVNNQVYTTTIEN